MARRSAPPTLNTSSPNWIQLLSSRTRATPSSPSRTSSWSIGARVRGSERDSLPAAEIAEVGKKASAVDQFNSKLPNSKLPNSKLPCEAPRESSLPCQACAVQFMQCGEAKKMQAERSLHETWTTRSSPSYTRSNCRPAYPSKMSGCWCLGGKCQQRNLVECTRIINLVSLVRNSFKKKLAQMRVPSLEPPTPPYHVKSTANSCLRRMIGSTRSRHPCADKLDSKKNGYSSTPPTPPSPPARSSSFNNNLLPKHSTIFPLYHQFLSSSIFLVSNSQHVQGVSATRAP